MRKLFHIVLLLPLPVFGQTPSRYNPGSFDLYQRLNYLVYDPQVKFHSSLRPYLTDDALLQGGFDSIFNYKSDSTRRSWAHRKLFHEHLVQVDRDDYSIYADYLPDLQVGRESEGSRGTWLNTRGFQFGGAIGKKFSFYTNFFENQASLPGYLDRIVTADSIVVGQAVENHLLANRTRSTTDWSYSSALVSFTPVKYVNLQLGYDKNFIGDGYRSMLMSDVAANYPFFKATAELGSFKYMAMWAQMQDLKAPQLSYENGVRKKWGVFHYLDWSISSRLSLGLFEAVIWQAADVTGRRGFDFSYLNPIILLRPVERNNGSPDNALIGLNTHFEALRGVTLYGQFILDELTVSEFVKNDGYWGNKWALQLGIRGGEPFGIRGLNYLAEFNTARPYMYTEAAPIDNFAHFNQPIAHPLGANFREWLTIWNWNYQRLGLRLQYNIAEYGVAPAGQNVGQDLFQGYNTHARDYGNRIGQGITTSLNYLDFKVSFMIKPRLNFRLEAGYADREQRSTLETYHTRWLTLGIRSSFRNLYQDF